MANALKVAVTGPTGTFGAGLLPLLEADPGVASVVGLARRPFDPASRGWSKLRYRQGDVRDPEALRDAFRGVDVVVHLAFRVAGAGALGELQAINVEGTMNVARAAAAVGAERLVYASSVAVYGFFDDNPIGMTESWRVRQADHLFYAQQKALIEERLAAERGLGGLEVFLLRPSIVAGPHVLGAKVEGPEWLQGLLGAVGRLRVPLKLPLPVLVPDFALQLVHEDDVGQALMACVHGDGPPGAYNIAGDGEVSLADVVRELGGTPVTVIPSGLTARAGRAVAALPGLPPAVGWAEFLGQPSLMDTAKAKRELGFAPAYTALETLRDTLGRGPRPAR